MNDSKISVRYAKALFQAASESKLEKKVFENLTEIVKAFDTNEFKFFLYSPVIKKSDKKKIFVNALGSFIDPLTMNFLQLLLSHNREQYLFRIARYYKTLYNKAFGIVEVDITFPVSINLEISDRIRYILKDTYKSEITLNEHINPAIIGGFILKINDEQYDASVRSSLKRMKAALSLN
jgi:F-type H+-transporting ATPase subunit delta